MSLTPELQSNVIIHNALGDIIEYTVNWLAPLFGPIERESPLPWAMLFNRATSYYYSELNAITFKENQLQEDNRILGHEVSHYLHDIVNPGIIEYAGEYEPANLAELVAEYGGLIFSSYEHPVVEQKKIAIFNELTNRQLEEEIMTALEKTSFERMQYDIHEGGCSAAYFLFDRYNTKYLQYFVAANVETAKKLLLELGWRRPLFVSYEDRNKEYEYEIMEEDEYGARQLVTIAAGGKISDIPKMKEIII